MGNFEFIQKKNLSYKVLLQNIILQRYFLLQGKLSTPHQFLSYRYSIFLLDVKFTDEPDNAL